MSKRNKVKCNECGRPAPTHAAYCPNCFNALPRYTSNKNNTALNVLGFIYIAVIIAIAVFVGNVVYAIYR